MKNTIKKRNELRTVLLATSSALAMFVVQQQLAQAGPLPSAACDVNNTFTGLPNTTAINCISFNNGADNTGDITNAANGTITATGVYTGGHGPDFAGSATGISVLGSGTTLTGNIINNGTITAPHWGINIGSGVFSTASTPAAGASVVGSITNSGSISANTGIIITHASITGSITNTSTGVITTPSNVGISVGQGGYVGGAVINEGTLTNATISISEGTVAGTLINGSMVAILNTNSITTVTGSAGIEANNGGSLGGSIVNSGSITSKVVGITVYPNIVGGAPEVITGSIINATGGTINAHFGIQLFATNSNARNTITGNVANNGTITASAGSGVQILSVTIGGAVTNTGMITATQNGIQLLNYNTSGANAGVATIAGGVTNSGTIKSTGTDYAGIVLAGAVVSNGITNALGGTINATNGVGILITNAQPTSVAAGPSTVTGGISNNGTITAGNGIEVTGGSNVDLITNSGSITGIIANGVGIGVTHSATVGAITNATGATISSTANTVIGISVANVTSGTITNNGTISMTGYGPAIDANEAIVNGNIVNNGQATGNSTGVIQIVNGGTVNGLVENFGTLTTSYTANGTQVGAGIYVFSSSGGLGAQTITGSIVNETAGKISGGFGIQVFATNTSAPVTIAGTVTNAGTIGTSLTPVAHSGIVIGSATVQGALINSGTIVAAADGMQLISFTTVAALRATIGSGVTNSGSITSNGTGFAGIALDGAKVSSGITNASTGAINATNGVGILVSNTGKLVNATGVQGTFVGGASTVSGGITNNGTITAKTGILVNGGSVVTVGITNTGSLTGSGGTAIDVTGEGALTTINQQGGTITGNILLSTLADIVTVTGGTISGNIVGQGSNIINFAPGVGNTFTYAAAYGFSGINQVNVNSGTTILDGTNSATATTIAGGATLQLGSGGTSGSLTGSLTDNGIFAIDRSDLFTFATTISGTGSFVQMGSGTTVLSGPNTFSGGATISAGTLQVTNSTPSTSSSIGTGTLTFNGGTLQAGANNLVFSNGATINTTGIIDTNGDNLTWSGVIGGAGALTAASTTAGGVLTLTNTNLYSGATTINTGATLALTGTGSIASSSGVADNGTFNISGLTNGGTSIVSLSGSGAVALGTNTLTLSNASGTFSGGIAGSGGLTLTTGSETLTGTNLYSGATTINGGTLALSGTGAIASSSGVADNGTFTISGLTNGGTSIVSLSGSGAVTLGTNTLTLSNASGTFSGGIGGTGGLTLTAGSESLTGTNAYSGATTINGGTLALSGTGAIASSSVADNGTFTISGVTGAGASIVSLSGSGIVTLGGKTLTLSNASGAFSGGIGGTGGLTLTTGTESLTGTNTYSGTTTISAGTLQIGAGGTTGAIASSSVADNGTLAFDHSDNVTFSSAISGSGGLSQIGSGTLILSGTSNTYTGATSVSSGTLDVTGSLGATAVSVGTGATLQGTGSIAGPVTINNGGTLAPGIVAPGTLTIGSLTLNAGSLLSYQLGTANVVGGATNDLTDVIGNLTINGGTLNVTNSGAFGLGVYQLIDYSGTLGGSGSLAIGTLPNGDTGVIQTTIPGEVNLVINGPGATTQFWDGATTTGDGTIHGGSGTWNNSNTNWTTSNGAINASWQGGIAVFAGTAGTVTLTQAIAYQGLQFMTTGYVLNATGSGALTPTGVAPINVGSGLVATIAAPIVGTGGVQTTGTGTLVLSGADTYSGGTNLTAGTLQLDHVTAGTIDAAGSGLITLGNATLEIAVNGTLANGLTANGATLSNISATNSTLATLTGALSLSAPTLQFGSATDAGTIVLAETATPSVTGLSTLEVAGGTLRAGSGSAALGTLTAAAASTQIDANAILDFNGNSATVAMLQGAGTLTNSVGATTTLAAGNFSGAINGAGAVTIAGGTTLTGTNLYSGATTINSGKTLLLSGTGSIASSSGVADNGTFNISGLTNGGASIVSLSGSGVVTLGTNTLTLSNASGAFSGGIAGSGGLTLTTGNETLSGTNLYSGTTTINGGTLALSGTGAIASSSGVADNGTFTISGLTNGGTSIVSLSGSGAVTLGTNTLTLSNASGTFSGGIGGTGGLTLTAGSEILTGTNLYSGATTINGGTLALSGSGAIASSSVADNGTFTISGVTGAGASIVSLSGSGIVTLGGKTLTLSNASGTFSGGIAGSGGLTLTTGSETLSGTNLYSGATTINGGTLALSGTGAIASSSVADNGTFTISGVSGAGASIVSLSGSGIVTLGGKTLTLSNASGTFSGGIGGTGGLTLTTGTESLTGTNTYSGTTTISGGTLQIGAGGTSGAIASSSVLDNGTLAFNHSNSFTFGGAVSGSGALSQTGSGTTILTGTNTYTGLTTISAGTLQIGAGGTTGAIASSSVADNGTLAFDHSDNVTFSSAISGSGGLSQIGSGTLILSGTSNTYTGATSVSSGTLDVTGSLGATAVSVGTGATLQGTGSIAGPVTINNGGTLAPGIVAPGTLTIGSLTLNAGSLLSYQLGTANVVGGATNDLTDVIGNLTINGGTLNVTNSGAFGLGVYQLIDYSGTLGGSGSLAIGTLPNGDTGVIQTTIPGEVNLVINGPGATTQFWDGATTTGDGTIHGGSGTWNNSNTNWTTSNGAINASWQGGIAVFAGTAGTVTLTQAIAYQGLQFMTTGYVLNATGSGALTPTGVAPINVGSGLVATIAAPIVGTGGVQTTGTGTLVLTGTDTYSGGTTISSGSTLQIGAGGAGATSGSIVGNVADNGTLAFARSDATTFGGVISGSGILVQQGLGTTILTGTNTYTGGTFLNNGTLAVSSDANLGAASGGLTFQGGALEALASLTSARSITLNAAGGTINVNGFSVGLTGTIAGAGALTDTGNGVLTLSGANTYAGGTTLASGTLVVGNNSALGTGTLAMAAGTTLSFLSSGNFTISNKITISGDPTFTPPAGTVQTISGVIANGGSPGTLVMDGAGTLVLSATNTYTGPTDVEAGILDVTGSIASSSLVTVAAGATLTGNGTIGSELVASGGTFAADSGTPGGSTNISGNLTFAAGASYLVALNPSTASFATVSGTATLAGQVIASFAPGSYMTKQYTILTAAGGLTGTFASLTNTILPGFNESLSYNTDDVFLNLTAALGSGGGLTVNEQNVAGGVNNAFNAGTPLPAGFVTLFGLSGSNLANALQQSDGEVPTDGEAMSFDTMNSFLSLMLDPFVYGRGASAGGFAADAGNYNAVLNPSAPSAPAPDPRWASWGATFGGSGTTNGDATIGSTTFNAQTYGVVAGADHYLTPDTVFGFAVSGGGTAWQLANGLGSGRSDFFQAGIYGTTHFGPAYIAGSLGFANQSMSTNRIAFMGDQLTAHFDAQTFGARLETGYRFGTPALGITPYGALQAQSFHTPTYSETDVSSGGFGLNYTSMNANDTRGELGARIDYLTAINNMPLQLRGRVAWAHDWVSDPSLTAVFQALPGSSFLVNGAPIPQNSALTTASAELHLTPSLALIAKFDGTFARGSNAYAGTGTLRYTW